MTYWKTFLILAPLAVACSGGGNPSPPTLGREIDRMGRAGVNTALTDPFNTSPNMTPDQVKDAYNASSDPSTWVATWAPTIAKNLAILDGLDRMCGNQLIAKPLQQGMVPPDRYMPLANVLADDQVFVNTNSSTCTTYLAVEANATNVIPNSDCGGRTPLYNTIDVTYSLLAIGMPSGVTNGITSDVDGNPNTTTFPFLGNPN